MSQYAVIFERADDGGWSAYAPDLGAVVAAADSREGVEIRMREALSLYAEEMERDGLSLPPPRSDVALLEA
jgi:predicted RNase H-like HicB family nuclease